jgi:hypothetical protein
MFDLLNPVAPTRAKPKPKLHDIFYKMKAARKVLVKELKEVCASRRPLVDARCEHVNGIDIIAAIRIHVEQLAAEQELEKLDA